MILEAVIALLLLLGGLFTLIGSLGLVRLRDFLSRLHAPTKSTTLGVGSLLLASALYFSLHTGHTSLHEVLVTLFLFITAPVSAHLLARAAIHLRLDGATPPAKPSQDTAPDQTATAQPPSDQAT